MSLEPRLWIHLRKDAIKFSSAHMTVFSDGSKEHLHGHNYQVFVSIQIKSAQRPRLISFAEIKSAMKLVANAWDEHVLLPSKCDLLKKEKNPVSGTLAFTLCGKYYALPQDEVVWLPVDNITSESLAEQYCRELARLTGDSLLRAGAVELHVRIEESPGQGASFELPLLSKANAKRARK